MNKLEKKQIMLNFNRACKTYDSFCLIQNKICQNAIELLLNHGNQFDTMCDFACGTGESTLQMIGSVKYQKCYAVDFAEKLLVVAKNKLPNDVECILSDFDKPIFTRGTLNLIFCNMGLQWSLNLKNTLSLFNDFLFQNGLFIFSLPVKNNFPEIKPEFKLNLLDHESIKSILMQTNFKLIESYQKSYIESFQTPHETLCSIKKVGANYKVPVSNNKKSGLAKHNIMEVFNHLKRTTTLTYQIGIYLAKKL